MVYVKFTNVYAKTFNVIVQLSKNGITLKKVISSSPGISIREFQDMTNDIKGYYFSNF